MTTRKTNMPYVRLGNSGLKVSKIILGTMQYGSREWQDWLLPEEEGIAHIKAAYDAGIQTFDTANIYSNGESERILGKAIKQHNLPREEIVVMTKLCGVVARTPGEIYFVPGLSEENGYVNQFGLNRKNIFEAVKHSLERLQLDYIDVLQCHRADHNAPIEETMQALHDVVKAGYVRYIGMSSCAAWQFNVMQNYAITHNLTPFISMQNHHSLVYREEEREMFPTLKHFGVGAIPWSPLARGYLTRPVNSKSLSQSSRAESDLWAKGYGCPSNEEIVNRVEKLAEKKGMTMAQVAVVWSMSKPGVSAPIVGTTSLKNLEELVAAVHLSLSEEEIKYLEEPYEARPVFM